VIRIKYGGDKKELYKHLEVRNDTDLQKGRDEDRNTHLEVYGYLLSRWTMSKS
jgi:hypothetical protein